MAIADVVTLGFGQTEIHYVTLLGFTANPGAVPALTPTVDGGGILVRVPPRSLTLTLKQGGR